MITKTDARWDQCLLYIKENITEQQYNTWFRPIAFESFDDTKHTLLLQVPSPFVYEYLEENFVGLLSKVLTRVYGEGVRLTYHSNDGDGGFGCRHGCRCAFL